MRVFFEATKNPLLESPEILWHVNHGWVWNVWQVETKKCVAVFFATLLCGDGCILHFSTFPDQKIDWVTVLAGMRKGLKMVLPYVSVVYATISATEEKLRKVEEKLGFAVVENGGFTRDDGTEILLLKYLKDK